MEKMGAQSLADLVRFAEKLGFRSWIPAIWYSTALPPHWTKVQYLSRFNSNTFHVIWSARSLSTEKIFECIDRRVFSEAAELTCSKSQSRNMW
jgi:hypothetical protein